MSADTQAPTVKDQWGMTQIKDWTHRHVHRHTRMRARTQTHIHARGLTGQSQRRGEDGDSFYPRVTVSLSRGLRSRTKWQKWPTFFCNQHTCHTGHTSELMYVLLAAILLHSPLSNPEFREALTIPTRNDQKTQMQTLIFNVIKKIPFDIYDSRDLSSLLSKHTRGTHRSERMQRNLGNLYEKITPICCLWESALIACSITAVNERSCSLNGWVAVSGFSDK